MPVTDMSGSTKEHPTQAIFSRSDQLHKALRSLQNDVEAIEQALLGIAPLDEPPAKAETPTYPFLEDVQFRFDDHIGKVENIKRTVSRIKESLINAPQIERSG